MIDAGTTPTFEGGCLCGAVRYRFDGPPLSSSNCFCRSCRLASGATPVGWVVVARRHFQWLQGAPALFQSSPGVTRGFCARCGSPLSYEHADSPSEIELTTGTLDDPDRCPPTREIFYVDRVRWAPSDPTLPHHANGSSDPPLPTTA